MKYFDGKDENIRKIGFANNHIFIENKSQEKIHD